MTVLAVILASFAAATFLCHIVSLLVAAWRCSRGRRHVPIKEAPPVTIIRPICGEENFLEATLRSSFLLHYPDYEVLFCAAEADDPAVAVAQRLIDDHPHISARIRITRQPISDNPKLNNMAAGWSVARHDWIVFADSNVLMPRDYIQHLLAARRADTALVCSPPVGIAPEGCAADLECAFLNTYQARWQLAGDRLGPGFAHGKTMLWNKPLLDRLGGIRKLSCEIAEDAAATKLVRAAGYRVRIVDAPFGQPLGRRKFSEVWARQVRWARLRRAAFPGFYALEILTGSLLPFAALSGAAIILDWPLASVVLFGCLWYGAEAVLARVARWPLSARSVVAMLCRDMLLPAVWVAGWSGSRFVWRGNAMRVAPSGV